MMKLLLTQVRLILPITLALYALGILVIYFGLPELVWGIAVFAGLGTYLGVSRLRRSEWYLCLPWSRRKIAGQIFGETLIIGLINIVLSSLGGLVFRNNILADEISRRFFSFAALICAAFGMFIGLAQALSGKPIRRQSIDDLKPGRRSLITAALLLFGWIFGPRLWAFSAPVVLWVIISGGATLFYLGFSSVIVIPENSVKRIRNRSLVVWMIAILVPVFASLYVVHAGSADNKYIPYAFHFLSNVSGKVSPNRAWELFESPSTPASPAFGPILKDARVAIGFENWKSRTLKCTNVECLELSSDFAQPGLIDSKDLERWFLVFAEVCKLEQKEEDRVRCSGPFLKGTRLEAWTSQFEQFGIFDQWLYADDPLKQLFAIQYAASKLDSKREARLRELAASADSRVQMMARTYIAWGELLRSSKLDCTLEKNRRGDTCRVFFPQLGNFK